MRLTTGFAAAAALALLVSAGQACEFHEAHVTASLVPVEEGVAMSTHDGDVLPRVDEATECAADAVDCVPASE